MKRKAQKRHPWLLSLIGRSGIALFAALTLTLLFFLLGQYQQFTESTELLLLRIIRFLGMASCLSMVYLVVGWIVSALSGNGFRPGRFALAVIGAAAGGASFAFSAFLMAMVPA